MKVRTLMLTLARAKPNKEVVIHSAKHEGFTADFSVQSDDNGDLEIYEVADSKPY